MHQILSTNNLINYDVVMVKNRAHKESGVRYIISVIISVGHYAANANALSIYNLIDYDTVFLVKYRAHKESGVRYIIFVIISVGLKYCFLSMPKDECGFFGLMCANNKLPVRSNRRKRCTNYSSQTLIQLISCFNIDARCQWVFS